jgi:hypothetical protein
VIAGDTQGKCKTQVRDCQEITVSIRGRLVGQDGILRADGIGARRPGCSAAKRPIDNRPQDAILPLQPVAIP